MKIEIILPSFLCGLLGLLNWWDCYSVGFQFQLPFFWRVKIGQQPTKLELIEKSPKDDKLFEILKFLENNILRNSTRRNKKEWPKQHEKFKQCNASNNSAWDFFLNFVTKLFSWTKFWIKLKYFNDDNLNFFWTLGILNLVQFINKLTSIKTWKPEISASIKNRREAKCNLLPKQKKKSLNCHFFGHQQHLKSKTGLFRQASQLLNLKNSFQYVEACKGEHLSFVYRTFWSWN